MDEIPNYLNNMNNPDDVKYDAPQLKDILSNTYGIIVYQGATCSWLKSGRNVA